MALQSMTNILGGGGSGAIRLSMPTLAGSDITAFDTDKVDLTGVTALKVEFANKRKSTEYESERTIRGVNVRAAKKDKTLDAVTGTIVAAEGQASSVEISFYANDSILSKIKSVVGKADQPIIAVWASGEVDGGLPKDYHIIGYIDGNLAEEYKEGVQVYTIKIVGGVGFTSSLAFGAYNTAIKTTPGKLAADGFDDTTEAVELTDITGPNLVTILSGEIAEVTRS